MYYAFLTRRGALSLSGADARPFLQGLVSNDVLRLKEGEVVYTALLSPQGRFLHDFFIIAQGEALLLEGDISRIPDLTQRLKLYKLRSQVKIEPMEGSVAAVWGGPVKPGGGLLFADPRLPELGARVIGERAKIEAWCKGQGMHLSTEADYERHRLTLGVPDGAQDMIADKSLLLEFGFETLHGIDFAKGCYVGQEVTARSKHRGQLHKGLYQVKAKSGSLPPFGTKVESDKEIGDLRSNAGNIGLAILRIEDVVPELHAGGIAIEVTRPRWLA